MNQFLHCAATISLVLGLGFQASGEEKKTVNNRKMAQTSEPAYCDPTKFSNYEISYPGSVPKNMHAYRIGKVVLVGMAVGNSKAKDVKNVAINFNVDKPDQKYCTWYFNDGNSEAENMFTWIDIPRPVGSDYAGMTGVYTTLIGKEFHTNPISFVSCATDYGYIGEGCNGMEHRGPSIFAMILAYSGCSANNSVQIANKIWGKNGIKVEMREALAQKAIEFASQNPAAAEKLRAAMESH